MSSDDLKKPEMGAPIMKIVAPKDDGLPQDYAPPTLVINEEPKKKEN